MNSPEKILLGLGGNEGDPKENIRRALDMLGGSGVRIIKISSFYKTSPVGPQDQPDFINAAALAETSLDPLSLLATVKEIEAALGRDPSARRWGPRPVDIDILFYGTRMVNETDLTVPHPRAGERLFVLEPVMEIAPDFPMPDDTPFSDFYRRRKSDFDFPLQDIEKIP